MVVEDAVKVSLVFIQVSVVGEAITAFGIGVFCITVVVADAVHPLDGSETVTP